jgi:hypothetical protein
LASTSPSWRQCSDELENVIASWDRPSADFDE